VFVKEKYQYSTALILSSQERIHFLCYCNTIIKKLNMKPDLFQSPDYYNLDDLLTDEHKLVRDSARAWVKRESPI
jgi:hypothetical protein